VLCPDRDQVGVAHMEDIAQDFPTAQWCYPYPESLAWQNLPKHGGLDVADWIASGATANQIRAAVGERRVLTPPEPATPKPLDVAALQEQMRDYLATDPSELALSAQVLQWHRASNLAVKDIWSLVKPLQAELEQRQERGERMAGNPSAAEDRRLSAEPEGVPASGTGGRAGAEFLSGLGLPQLPCW
jgi:predicted P-loop ATPase